MDSEEENRVKRKKLIKKSHDREHKDRKERKHKHQREERREDRREKQHREDRNTQMKSQKEIERQSVAIEQKVYVPRTHIQCRRCQNETFSLKKKQCETCGYPKEQRPANFPTTKQVDVMQLIRAGKMTHNSYAPVLIEVVVNDRMGRKNRIKCSPEDTIFNLKKLTAAQIGTRPQKIRLQKSNIIYKDHLTLEDYEIKDGMGLEMYYD